MSAQHHCSGPRNRPGHRTGRRRLLTVPGLVGIGYSLSWIAGLAVPAPSPWFGAPGAEVVAALAGHGPAVATQFALTEGLPAAGIAVISVALARAAGRPGAAGGPPGGSRWSPAWRPRSSRPCSSAWASR